MPAAFRPIGALLLAALLLAAPVRAAEVQPITIGFGMALSGGLAVVGKSGLVAFQIWAEDVNRKGGLLGRPVKLIYYDDQSNPATIPGIYTKLIEIDKVDLIVSGYATNMVAPAMPVVMQKNRLFFGLFALAVNSEFHYPKYFSMLVFGPDPKKAFSQGYFDLAMAQEPKPKTLAIVSADAEFARNASDGARDNAKAAGLKIVYDRTYPPTTVDFTPIVRAVQATNPDIVYVASYPPDTVGIVNSVGEIGLKTNMLGGGMVGLPTAALKQKLGPLMNGIVNVELWEPAPSLKNPAVMAFLAQYQAKAGAEGVDPLGYFLPPFAYAEMQILGDAITATGGLDEDKIAHYMHEKTFNTIVGDIAFGPDGEWVEARPLWVQYHGIKGSDLEQWKDTSRIEILLPQAHRTGKMVYPYRAARQP
jgi:branched-chain amino acid transport system substrate-binding protein